MEKVTRNSIELHNLYFEYDLDSVIKNKKHVVLNDTSLMVERGEVLCICGRSGQGKSTVLKIIAGLEKPMKGAIYYNGLMLKDRSALRVSQEKISYVFQNSALISNMTIFENVALPLRYNDVLDDEVEIKVKQVLSRMLVDEKFYNSYPHTLSNGDQKRIAIARALVSDPEILLMDEPTAGLDNVNKRSLIALIYNLQQLSRPTIVLVTHDLSLARFLNADIVFLEKGKLSKHFRYKDLDTAEESYIKDMLGKTKV